MNVSTQDKSTGNVKKITTKNEKGRLAKAEIDRTVADAEKFHAQDEEVRKRSKLLHGSKATKRLRFQTSRPSRRNSKES
jgi:L1 cell adhesion molecule like protein